MASDFLPTMSLPEVNIPQMTPITFSTPTPRKTDMSLLMQSLRMQEAREERAVEQSKQFDAVAANLKKELNPADYAWVDERVANARKDFEEEIARGNYSTAYKKAAAAGGMLAKDSQILSRQEANKEYDNKVKEVNTLAASGAISSDTRDYWLHKNAYAFDESSGKLKEYSMPVRDINYFNLAVQAAGIAAEKRGQSRSEVARVATEKGLDSVIYDVTNYQSKGVAEILENMKEIASQNPNAVWQDYQVNKWKFEQMMDDPSLSDLEKRQRKATDFKGFINGDSFVDYNTFFDKRVAQSVLGKNAAYYYSTTDTKADYGKSSTKSTGDTSPKVSSEDELPVVESVTGAILEETDANSWGGYKPLGRGAISTGKSNWTPTTSN